MQEYELLFRVVQLDDTQLDALDADLAFVYASHGTFNSLIVWREGTAVLDAAKQVTWTLRRHGIMPESMVEDLVTRQDIATRTGKTPQAVGHWIVGKRLADGPSFPPVHSPVANGVWQWGEVNCWLNAHGMGDALSRPLSEDITRLNAWLLDPRSALPELPLAQRTVQRDMLVQRYSGALIQRYPDVFGTRVEEITDEHEYRLTRNEQAVAENMITEARWERRADA